MPVMILTGKGGLPLTPILPADILGCDLESISRRVGIFREKLRVDKTFKKRTNAVDANDFMRFLFYFWSFAEIADIYFV